MKKEKELNFLSPGNGFLGLERQFVSLGSGPAAAVIPFGLEKSVSYGAGTSNGPGALIKASHEVELFDEEFWCEPVRKYGIHTLEPVEPASHLETAIDQLSEIVETLLENDMMPLCLGGEHSLTAGAVRPFAKKHDNLVVVQFDAHSDLRDGYAGQHFSHASAMRRVLDIEHLKLVSIGIRSISASEVSFLKRNSDRISIYWARDLRSWDINRIIAPLAGKPVYVTFDVDCFDSSLMPATGTPEPGGLFFTDVIEILRAIGDKARIVGGDVVELAPIDGLHAPDFVAAKIAYKLLTYAFINRIS